MNSLLPAHPPENIKNAFPLLKRNDRLLQKPTIRRDQLPFFRIAKLHIGKHSGAGNGKPAGFHFFSAAFPALVRGYGDCGSRRRNR